MSVLDEIKNKKFTPYWESKPQKKEQPDNFNPFENTIQALNVPGDYSNKGLKTIMDGDPLTGALQIGLGIANTIFLPVTLPIAAGQDAIRNAGRSVGMEQATQSANETMNSIFNIPANAYNYLHSQVNEALKTFGIDDKEVSDKTITFLKSKGILPQGLENEDFYKTLNEYGQLASTLVAFKGLHETVKTLKGEKVTKADLEKLNPKEIYTEEPKLEKPPEKPIEQTGGMNIFKGEKKSEIIVSRKVLKDVIDTYDQKLREAEKSGDENLFNQIKVERQKYIDRLTPAEPSIFTNVAEQTKDLPSLEELKIEERTSKNGKKYYYDAKTKKLTSKQKFEEQNAKSLYGNEKQIPPGGDVNEGSQAKGGQDLQQPSPEQTSNKPLGQKEEVNNNQAAIERMTSEGKSPEEISKALNVPVKDVKPIEQKIVESPRSELPPVISDKIKQQAEQKLGEISQAEVTKQGRFAKQENVGQGYETTRVISPFTVSDFPEWFSSLGKSKKEVSNALQKIIDDAGKDKGKLVENVKSIILEHLTEGEQLSTYVSQSGKGGRVPRGEVPPDAEILDAIEKYKKGTFGEQTSFENLAQAKFPEKFITGKGKGEETTPLFQQKPPEVKGQTNIFDEIFDIENARKNIQTKGQNLTSGIDPTLLKDYATVGAYHLGNLIKSGVDKAVHFTEWSKNMIKEFGEKIKPYLFKIWDGVKKEFGSKLLQISESKFNPARPLSIVERVKESQSDLTPKQKFYQNIELGKLAKTKQEFLDNPRFDENFKRKMAQLIEDLPQNKKVETSRVIGLQTKLYEKMGQMTRAYGQVGGELVSKFSEGNSVEAFWKNWAWENILNPMARLQDKVGSYRFKNAGRVVIKALQDRKNAETILADNPIAREMYGKAVKFYDTFKQELVKKERPVLEDYFTHILDVLSTDEALGLLTNENIGKRNINQFISAKSPFLKERLKEEIPMQTDLFGVMHRYLNSVTKDIAYKDAVDFAYNGFIEGIAKDPRLSQFTKQANEFIQSNLRPEYEGGFAYKTAGKIRQNLYTALLWNNIKAAAMNTTQRQLVKSFVSPEAYSMAKKLFRNKEMPTGRLADALSQAGRETPPYLEVNLTESQKGKLQKGMESKDTFRKSERGNWKVSELSGVLNSVMRDTGAKTLAEINKALGNQKVFDKAVREARYLAGRTQMSVDAAIRPKVYDRPWFRTLAMFTRFPLGQFELLSKTLFSKLEGANGLRAQTILSRGLMEDTRPVEFLRETEWLRKNIEAAVKETQRQNITAPTQAMNEYVNFLKGKEKELNGLIKKIEPLNGGNKWKQAGIWAQYSATATLISFSYKLIVNQLWDAINADDNRKKKTIGDLIQNSILDASPIPAYKLNPKEIFSPAFIPDIPLDLYGNLNLRGGLKSSIDYGVRTTPLGLVNETAKRITGESAGGFISKKIVPYEKSNSITSPERTFRRTAR